MTRARLDGLRLLLLGSLLFILLGTFLESVSPVSMMDFKAVYYSARSLLQHGDPYSESNILHIYLAEDGEPQAKKLLLRDIVALDVNLPPTLTLIAPIAFLPWGAAHLIWMLLTAGSFILAAYLMWELGAANAPVISGGLLCLLLAGSELLLEVGNTAGIIVSLCAIAVWCFLRERFKLAGMLCLAVALLVKPQDAGFVWLYFLLAGGVYRKRALQTLLLAVVLGLPAILWVSNIAPNWMHELQSNILETSAHGAVNDPGPAQVDPRSHGAIMISLQTVVSVFRDDPRIYNPVTYLVCAPLLLVWVIATLRRRSSPANARLALAAIAALSMLPLYHRQHDAALLLLTVPACAMLWAEGGPTAWLALVFTSLGSVCSSTIPMQLLAIFTTSLRASVSGLSGKVLTILVCRPAPLILLAMGVFYLWVYVRHNFARSSGQACSSVEEYVTIGSKPCSLRSISQSGVKVGQ
jgi:hypothetical protein